jgi:hypothetical protein
MKKKIAIVGAVVAGIIILAPVVVPFLCPWTRLNCKTEYIDIACGRYRATRHLYWIKISESEEETPTSRMYRDLLGEPPEQDWRRLYMFSPLIGNSPLYVYHGALRASSNLHLILSNWPFSEEAKRTALRRFFDLLQKSGSYHMAARYVNDLGKQTSDSQPDNDGVVEKYEQAMREGG